MRVFTACLLYFPITLLASDILSPTQTPATSLVSLETPSLNQPSETALAFSIQTSTPEKSLSEEEDLELRKRQAAGQVAGGVASATVATQQSPVTTYMAYGPGGVQTPVVFTQLFSQVPDQWDGPTVGSIGLGTITGRVGVVKTKRNFVAQATEAVVMKIRGETREREEQDEEVLVQKRASNAAVASIGSLDAMRQLVVTMGGSLLAIWLF